MSRFFRSLILVFFRWWTVSFLWMNNLSGRSQRGIIPLWEVVAFGGSYSFSSIKKAHVSIPCKISLVTTTSSIVVDMYRGSSWSDSSPSFLQLSFSPHDHDDDDDTDEDDDDDDAIIQEPMVPLMTNEESLLFRFQRAVVLQRAGEYNGALREYQTFVKAAESCQVSPEMYAEVHVNMGAIYMRLKNWSEARYHFKKAIQCRDVGNAHVNLALCLLAERQASSLSNSSSSSSSSSSSTGTALDRNRDVSALKEARYHCQRALDIICNDVQQEDDYHHRDHDVHAHAHAKNTAIRLMSDIEKLLRQMQIGQ